MNKKIPDPIKQVAYLSYINRENSFRHTDYDEEMKQYALMQAGDPSAVEESAHMMERNQNTHISKDPVRNVKYLFIANITITTRFAIEGGMDSETAYNSSDLYIRKMDTCNTIDEVMDLHREMFTYFTERMANQKKENVFAKSVIQCMRYIDAHLHVPIRMRDLAAQVSLNPSYLSTLFKKETGMSISDYVLQRRIDTARNMLRYSDYPSAQISEILAFNSQSYFIRCFRNKTCMTPNEYRQRHFAESITAANQNG